MDHTFIVNLFALMALSVFTVPVGILFFFNWKLSQSSRKKTTDLVNIDSLKEAGIDI